MVFLVFSEVLEMSSEVVGPGPTHGRSNLSGLTWDLLLVPSRPMPDACYPLVCLLCVWGGGSSRGAVLAAFAPSWRCPQSSLFLYNIYKIQLSRGGIGATPQGVDGRNIHTKRIIPTRNGLELQGADEKVCRGGVVVL